ncbi:hypothetical protein J422_01228 [Methanocaldococcus villosus KIN24-T80]|uniref:Dihydroneopterin aldolase n=1 Tax=Methanocaldococcus villosus KIN24-T80 TaxID=1069083 RepID=N6VTX5_9EURY|nr:dihydroneopterin aldolase family protein [Methanocaldococcus villosus]ENN96621.1 hypothetical protein J422_01228 [Methanocaldococcus villosus KIN24-T80]
MRVEEEELFNKYFKNLSQRERAIFEGGIKLGAIFHQFIGTPVSKKNKDLLERAIEESIKNQPFVYDIKVKIKNVSERYKALSEDMLDVDLIIKVSNVKAYLKLEYVKELSYPLMYVKKVEE